MTNTPFIIGQPENGIRQCQGYRASEWVWNLFFRSYNQRIPSLLVLGLAVLCGCAGAETSHALKVPSEFAVGEVAFFIVPEPEYGPEKKNWMPSGLFTKAHAAAPVPDRPDALFGFQVRPDYIRVVCRTNIPAGQWWVELQEEYREPNPIWVTKQGFEIEGPAEVLIDADTDALRRWRVLLQDHAAHLQDVAAYWENSTPTPLTYDD